MSPSAPKKQGSSTSISTLYTKKTEQQKKKELSIDIWVQSDAEFYQQFPPLLFAIIDHCKLNQDQIKVFLHDQLKSKSLQESDWKQSAFYLEFKAYQQHLLGPIKTQLQNVFDNDCPKYLLPKRHLPKERVDSHLVQIEWRFPQTESQVHWGQRFCYFSTVVETLIPPTSSSFSHDHVRHPTDTDIHPVCNYYSLLLSRGPVVDPRPTPFTLPNTKFFFSVPHIDNDTWIQFHGPGCLFTLNDPTWKLYVGSLLQLPSTSSFTSKCTALEMEMTSPHRISIIWL